MFFFFKKKEWDRGTRIGTESSLIQNQNRVSSSNRNLYGVLCFFSVLFVESGHDEFVFAGMIFSWPNCFSRPFVFSENLPTQPLHQQSRSVHQFAVYSNNPCCKLVSIQKMSPWTARCGSHQCHLLIPFAPNVQELSSLSLGSSSADATRREKGLATTLSSSLHASSTLTCLSRHHCQTESPRGPWYFVHVSDDEGENTPFEISTLHD